nr:SPX domain-containing protein 1-like [Tanacetum cinerariifolium]
MKFGKSLSNQIEQTLPEWRDKFLSYKDLKKSLKLINASKSGDACDRAGKRQRLSGDGGAVVDGGGGMSKEEIDFVELLEKEIEKFNLFFIEKEEDLGSHEIEVEHDNG